MCIAVGKVNPKTEDDIWCNMAARTTKIFVSSGLDVLQKHAFKGQHLVIPSADVMVIIKSQRH